MGASRGIFVLWFLDRFQIKTNLPVFLLHRLLFYFIFVLNGEQGMGDNLRQFFNSERMDSHRETRHRMNQRGISMNGCVASRKFN